LRIAVVTIVSVLTMALAACGDEEERSTVDVTLKEWEVAPAVESVVEGEVTFNASNEGEEEHELVVVRTEFAAADLPTRDNGSVDEDADGVDVIGETAEMEGGDDDSRVFTLDPGSYVLLCNLVHEGDHDEPEVHYQMGMFSAFEVTAKP
jgi:hypothetical protein